MRPIHVWQLVACWLYTFAFCVVAVTLTLGTFGLFSHRLSPALLRNWGRTLLWLIGMRVEVVEGREHLEADAAKVVTFNHTSLLDAFICTAIFPPGSTAAVKRELMYYPFVGAASWAFGFLFIDRGHSDKAKRTMARAGARMQRDRLTVFISPEGTRSRTGELLPFKKGAFHLARDAGAPIVPMVIENAMERLPMGSFAPQPGVIRVRLLAPRRMPAEQDGSLADEAEALRNLYLRETGAPAAPTAAAAAVS